MGTARPHRAQASRAAEASLIARLGNHEEAALRDLIALCGRFVYGKALQVLQEPHLAEEVAQDTLLVLWWDPARFDEAKGGIRTFLMGIARYKAIDAVRRRELIHSRETLLTDADQILLTPPDDEIENGIALRAAISSLSVAKREVLFLAFYRGLTYRQVARVMDLPEGTVKTRIRDSLHRLRTAMAIGEVT